MDPARHFQHGLLKNDTRAGQLHTAVLGQQGRRGGGEITLKGTEPG